jgi:predicted RNA-binding Zn-ribbon protein involved in translation (DUF1610 family)
MARSAVAELTCPQCGADVPATGVSGKTGLGVGGGKIAWQPENQHTECAKCGAKLERNLEPPMDQWRLARSEQTD